MADWQEAVQASVIALIFALMLAKLVSVVISFRGENLRVEREAPEGRSEEVMVEDTSSASESDNWDEDQKTESKGWEKAEKKVAVEETDLPLETEFREVVKGTRSATVGLYPLIDERSQTNPSPDVEDEGVDKVKLESGKGNLTERDAEAKTEADDKNELEIDAPGELSDSDGWEGVESSELDERFGAAAAFVATQAVRPGLKVSNETQLLLYGLYKTATEGPCSSSQPSAYKMSARAKWNSWQKLGNIGSEEAMHRYVAVVSEISPSWAQGTDKTDQKPRTQAEVDASQRGGMGPVFSSLLMNEEGEEGLLETIHIFAREGDQAGLQQQIEQGTAVDLKDSDGRTALHWAVDRGHLCAVELLLARGAQINAKDSEGQTALHYATTCEREEIAQYLLKKGAEPSIMDNEGVSPLVSRPGHWFWMGV